MAENSCAMSKYVIHRIAETMGSTIIGSGQNMLLVASEVDMMMMTRRLRNVRAI